MFAYNLITNQPPEPGDLRNEIDFEFASNYWTDNPPVLNTNVYGAQNEGGTNKMGNQNAPGVNFQDVNTFAIDFNPAGGPGPLGGT